MIAVSGTAPLGPDGKTVGAGDPATQARRCLEIIKDALERAGSSLQQVVRTRTLLTRIDDWQAELKPAQKIAWLDARAAEGRKVLMAGDGLNDAPALAAAHASISPSSAADISQRTADFVFQGEKLAPVLEAIAVGKRARSMALQNFAVALVYNVICVPLAVAGFVTPLIAAIVMSTSSILVTANAARLAGRGRT